MGMMKELNRRSFIKGALSLGAISALSAAIVLLPLPPEPETIGRKNARRSEGTSLENSR